MNEININFENVTGNIKPLHGVCCAPYVHGLGNKQIHIEKYFKEAEIPFCRLHDCCGSYGGTYFVDVPNIFRDFSADENDPESYDFYYTDEYIKAIAKTGCAIYYRLGVTIEWGSKKYTTLIPPDFMKWARICEHIILHYNHGWADGFNLGIEYWEIWNEPENPGNESGPSMWGGTKEEFFDLYIKTSKYLKARFPYIKAGGYGSCGFYTETREKLPAGFETFVPYFKDFLKAVKENGAPLDFFSWHIYTGDEKELLCHAKFARETLDNYGFEHTESHLNEWNIHSEGQGFTAKHTMEGAAFNAAVLLLLQNTNYVDKAMYYCFSYSGIYNGFLNQNDKSVDAPWYAFAAFGKLYSLGQSVETLYDNGKGLYAAAAKGEGGAAVVISNYNAEDSDAVLKLKGLESEKNVSLKLLSADSRLEEQIAVTVPKEAALRFKIERETVVLIEIS